MEAIRVLIADDSRIMRMMVRQILERDPAIEIVGEAANGQEALDLTLRVHPHLIILDIMMPVMDGLQAVEEIMARRPTPILVLSGHVDPEDSKCAFKAIALGALDVMVKTEASCAEDFPAQLLEKVKFLAGIRVMHHFRGGRRTRRELPAPTGERRILAIGASTGGPKAIQYLLRSISPLSRPKIVIVQHIAPGFSQGFARWLGEESPFSVRVARNGDPLQEGVALVAPDGLHMEVRDGRIQLSDAPVVNSCRPSIDVLFSSLAGVHAPNVLALLLTGMGRDGAAGMLRLREAGAYNIVQDEKTSTIYGMPAAAVALGAAHRILALDQIPEAVAAVMGKKDQKASTRQHPVL